MMCKMIMQHKTRHYPFIHLKSIFINLSEDDEPTTRLQKKKLFWFYLNNPYTVISPFPFTVPFMPHSHKINTHLPKMTTLLTIFVTKIISLWSLVNISIYSDSYFSYIHDKLYFLFFKFASEGFSADKSLMGQNTAFFLIAKKSLWL